MLVQNIMSSTAANSVSLIEMFSSIQGEGELAGYRQIFIRFPGCNLDCAFCDTEIEAPLACRVETAPGSGFFEDISQPVHLDTVIEIVKKWCKQLPLAHHSISITGGEPMLHADLLARWLPELNILLPIHLETNGTLPESLPKLIEHIDFISMDIKLPTSAATPEMWDEHRRFLEIALERDVSVKVIVGALTTEQELLQACKLVADVDDEIALIIQPVTGRDGKVAVPAECLMRFQAVAAKKLCDVRVLPQMHRFLEVA
jgi:7-carboxy-7-deazaguanine synthase